MEFFNSAIDVLQTLVIALGAGLGVWGVINLLEGYGNDNPGAVSSLWSGAAIPLSWQASTTLTATPIKKPRRSWQKR